MSDIGVLVTLDEESIKNKIVLDYTSRDFNAIRAQLVGLARGLVPEWITVGESPDFGTVILELFAYMGDILHFYIDRTASEAFLSTAQRQESVLHIADMFGYVPIGQHAASVTLTFSMNESLDPDNPLQAVTLPKGTRVHNSDTDSEFLVVFETAEEFTINPGDGIVAEQPAIEIYATEGVTKRDVSLGQAFGVPNTNVVIPDKGVIYGTVDILTIEGFQTIQWQHITDISLARPNQTVFTTYLDDAGFTHVVFGDNASGRIPSVNSQIWTNYRFGVGALANRLTKDSINVIVPPPDVDVFDVKVTNENPPLGGSDPESIDAMKYSIPRAGARIRNRAVTLNDYADLALQVPGVAKSVAYGTVYTAVRIRIAPIGMDQDEAAMARLCNAVGQYMGDKILIGSTVLVEPIDSNELWEFFYLRIRIFVTETYNRTAVREQVEAVIRKMCSYDVVDFGTRVSLGEVYRAILTVAGVDHSEVHWLSTVEPPSGTVLPASPTTPSNLDTPGSVNDLLLSGQWKYKADSTPESGFYFSSSVAPETLTVDDAIHGVVSTDVHLHVTGQLGVHNSVHSHSAGGVNLVGIETPVLLALSIHDADYPDTDDRQAKLLSLTIGDHILTRPVSDTWAWWDLVVTAPPTLFDHTTDYVQVRVTVHQTADDIGNLPLPNTNDPVLFDFIRFNPTPSTSGNVADIVTDELLIPRIEPTEVEETMTSLIEAGMTLDERTHDGLWVVAEGGIANS